MMDHFEHDLAVALRSAVGSPPTEIDPDPIIRTKRHGRARTIGAPLATALLIAAIVATVLAIVHTGGPAHQAASPPPAEQPGRLIGSWVLTDLQGLDGAAHTRPDATLIFHFAADGSVTQGCSAARVTVSAHTLRFVQQFISAATTNCRSDLSVQQGRFLFGHVLIGTANWSIHQGGLTVHHGTAGAVFQRAGGGELTPEQRALAVRIAKREAQLSPPSGSSTPTTATNGEGGWPSNVDRVWAIVTTHADAMQYVGAAGGDPSPVLVIRLVGNFSWITTGPPGHGPAIGNVATVVADARTGRTTDAGLEQQNPPQPLPNATVLYQR